MRELFNVDKPIIGMIHFLPLPGTPLYDEKGGMKKIYTAAIEDALKLKEGGVDAILYCNEGDRPYSNIVSPAVIASVAYLISKIQKDINLPFGINILLDSIASISIAHVTGASFIRAFLTGEYVGDMGIMKTYGPETIKLRRDLHAQQIKVFANITAGFAVPIAQRSLEDSARGAVFVALADALCVSGSAAGVEIKQKDVQIVKKAVPNVPVIVSTGVNKDNIKDILKIADGVIIGTALKIQRETLNPVDIKQVKEFMKLVREIRKY